jgi:hypothetical protein
MAVVWCCVLLVWCGPAVMGRKQCASVVLLLLLLLLFILTANGFLPGGSGNTMRHNKQITHITQNNTTIKRNTAHRTTHTIKDTLQSIDDPDSPHADHEAKSCPVEL